MNQDVEQILEALRMLKLDGDELFRRIEIDLKYCAIAGARMQLNFVDELLKAYERTRKATDETALR